MTKRIETMFRRHPHSYRSPEGKKFDGPSLDGFEEIRRIRFPFGGVTNTGVIYSDSNKGRKYQYVEFNASPTYRAQITAQILKERAKIIGELIKESIYFREGTLEEWAQTVDIEEILRNPQELLNPDFCEATDYNLALHYLSSKAFLSAAVITAPAIRPMTRSSEYEKAMKTACPSGEEDDIIAYSLNLDNNLAGTETPAELGQRNLDHILGLQRHFEHVPEGKIGYIENITHEPNLTAVMMRVLNLERYDVTRFQGAAKTTEAIAVTMEQRNSGIIEVTFQYRDQTAQMTL